MLAKLAQSYKGGRVVLHAKSQSYGSSAVMDVEVWALDEDAVGSMSGHL